MAEKSDVLTGVALAWFWLFPSLGIMQKYFGTAAAFACFGAGFVVLAGLSSSSWSAALKNPGIAEPWLSPITVVLFAVLVVGFVVLYPVTNAHVGPSASYEPIGGGSDRDESLKLGVRELLAGRFPYYQQTQLENYVTQLPGSLLLAVPFALAGNAVWQNLFWFGAFSALVRYVFGRDLVAAVFIGLTVVACPSVLQDFVTGGDLAVNAITLLAGMFLIVKWASDTSVPNWQKFGIAAFTGIALSSRLNYLLLLPPLFAALARRVGVNRAAMYLVVIGVAFVAVTLPFYWHDPAAFAPLYLHDKFSQFEGEVRGAGMLFPVLSLLFSVLIALYPGNQDVEGWLIQSGLVLTVPVVFLVALATARAGTLNFTFTDYAVAGAFFGGMGAALRLHTAAEPAWTVPSSPRLGGSA